MRARVEEFRPADLGRIIRTAATAPGVHPTLDDLAAMAEDTLNGARLGLVPSGDQQKEAARTIAEVRAAKETSSCQSTKRP